MIRDHLAEKDRELWIWGDRLLEGKVSGLGMWEASENDTYPAIDMIYKDVVICDWHYESADPTAAIFALKGFRVITCPWRNPDVTRTQLKMMETFRTHSVNRTKDRYYGFVQTVWSDAGSFLDEYYSDKPEDSKNGQVRSFNEIIHFYSQSN